MNTPLVQHDMVGAKYKNKLSSGRYDLKRPIGKHKPKEPGSASGSAEKGQSRFPR